MEARVKKLGQKDYSYAVVASCASDRSVEGKSISEINRLRGRKKKIKDEIETILDIEAQGGAQMVYHSMGDEDVDRIMRYANTASPVTAAYANSAWACRIRVPMGRMRACWRNLCASGMYSRSRMRSGK